MPARDEIPLRTLRPAVEALTARQLRREKKRAKEEVASYHGLMGISGLYLYEPGPFTRAWILLACLGAFFAGGLEDLREMPP